MNVTEIPLALIGGREPKAIPAVDSKNPWDGTRCGSHGVCGPNELEQSIVAASSGFQKTRRLASFERAKVLSAVSEALEDRSEFFAELITREVGKPLRYSRVEVQRAVATFAIASEESKRIGGEIVPLDLNEASRGRVGMIRRFPVGIVAGISPFNFPLNLVAHKLAPAMAAGNAFILKPASVASLSALALGRLILEAGYPAEAVNVVPAPGRVADPLVIDPRISVVTFTGSAPVGWSIKARAGRKKVVLELGGNAGVIVDASADLDDAVTRIVAAAFAYSGQVCIKTQRVFVHRALYEKFATVFAARSDALHVGDPMDPATVVGPMIDDENAERVDAWVSEAMTSGARRLTSRKREGRIVPPVVLADVPSTAKVVCEEVFGPVVTLQPFDTFDEAVSSVNASPFGLQAGVFTNDLANAWKAYEGLDVGGVILNDASSYRIDHMPYGGVKESGFGREGVKYAIESMTEPRLFAWRVPEGPPVR